MRNAQYQVCVLAYITDRVLIRIPCSCARLHSAGLDSNSDVWTFTSWGRPFRLASPLLDKSSPDTTAVQVESGWGYTSVLTESGDVLVYWPGKGRMHEELHRVKAELDQQGDVTRAKLSSQRSNVIPCHVWDLTTVNPVMLPAIPHDLPHLNGTGLAASVLDSETKLVRIAGLDNNLIGLTNKGHVLKYDKLDDEDSYQRGRWEYVSSSSLGPFRHPTKHDLVASL